MYLLSLYFDEQTAHRITQYIKQVAAASGNPYMLENHVSPHITLSAFETNRIEPILEKLDQHIPKLPSGTLQWASAGQFFPYVLFLAPVLNEYLHTLSVTAYQILSAEPEVSVSRYYRPFQWLPHTTIGKKLSPDELLAGVRVLQNSFGLFRGDVVRIGLAKTNPYEDLVVWELKK